MTEMSLTEPKGPWQKRFSQESQIWSDGRMNMLYSLKILEIWEGITTQGKQTT